MALEEYDKKRSFESTPEPKGTRPESKPGETWGGTFCVQRHRARRLHYDLRIEVSGALRSWAVPEGPSLDPAVWAENIPFNETRDYVKKVLSNATYYAALLSGQSPASLKARLGRPIGPSEAGTPDNKDLP